MPASKQSPGLCIKSTRYVFGCIFGSFAWERKDLKIRILSRLAKYFTQNRPAINHSEKLKKRKKQLCKGFVIDMINAGCHDKPLVIIRAMFQAINEADSCLLMRRAGSKPRPTKKSHFIDLLRTKDVKLPKTVDNWSVNDRSAAFYMKRLGAIVQGCCSGMVYEIWLMHGPDRTEWILYLTNLLFQLLSWSITEIFPSWCDVSGSNSDYPAGSGKAKAKRPTSTESRSLTSFHPLP